MYSAKKDRNKAVFFILHEVKLVFQFSFQELSVQASDVLDRDALRTF